MRLVRSIIGDIHLDVEDDILNNLFNKEDLIIATSNIISILSNIDSLFEPDNIITVSNTGVLKLLYGFIGKSEFDNIEEFIKYRYKPYRHNKVHNLNKLLGKFWR